MTKNPINHSQKQFATLFTIPVSEGCDIYHANFRIVGCVRRYSEDRMQALNCPSIGCQIGMLCHCEFFQQAIRMLIA
jgi:hypothetical protein